MNKSRARRRIGVAQQKLGDVIDALEIFGGPEEFRPGVEKLKEVVEDLEEVKEELEATE